MKYFDIPDAELEKLYNTGIYELELSVRMQSSLARAGCSTVAELAYMSIEELQELKRMPKDALEEVQEKLAARNIFLMSQEEKQQVISEKDNPNVLHKQILMLNHMDKQKQDTIARLEREANDKWEGSRRKRNRALKEARGIFRTSRYPMARLLESMYFGDSAHEGCRLCDILELWDGGCLLKDDSMEGNEIQHSCEECIELFLADYYWGQRLQARLAAEQNEVPKVMRMHINSIYKSLEGCCPVCKDRVSYGKNINFCSCCGSPLNWDEENWDEETRENIFIPYDEWEDDENDEDGEE